jgi:hypothetical protein
LLETDAGFDGGNGGIGIYRFKKAVDLRLNLLRRTEFT